MIVIFGPSAAFQATVRLEATVRNSIPSQVSVLSSCHFPLTESQGTVFYLTSIKNVGALTPAPSPNQHPCPSPPCCAAPLQFTTMETQRQKSEEGSIRMGNLPVILRTTAKRAIHLINSLFCCSLPGPHPSSRPLVHHPPTE